MALAPADGNSGASDTQYEQWNPTDNSDQRFTPISRSTGTGPSGGAGPVRSGVAGKCLDATGGGTADGTRLELWDCNTSKHCATSSSSEGRQPCLG
ncbi:RICIN domain-containing protein [Actinacidiphila sp. bgisy144]|uniref:RICIN domain-containing protein n=1 Tax=Actinacidiphila sp. bgisy144 TaxID=3413791 RepID=UPI003EB874C1